MPLEPLVGRRVEQRKRRQAGGRRERIARQRARLVGVAGRRKPLHQRARPGDGGQRQAAAEHLAEHGEVGRDAEALLRAAARDAKAA